VIIVTSPVPAAVSNLGLGKWGANAALTWSHTDNNVHHYEVWRANNAPYFNPGDPGSTKLADVAATCSGNSMTYTDTSSGLGDTANNSFYVAYAVNSAGQKSGLSNRVGEFDFALVRGVYNTIALPLVDSGLATADDLGAATGAIVVSRWVASTQSLDSRIVGVVGNNFSLSAGAAYFVYTPGSGPTVFTTMGSVPVAGGTHFTIERGSPSSCRLNLLTLPLDQSGISTADGLATAMGGVPVISVWRADTGGFDSRIVGVVGNNFAVRIGYPYWPCADTSGGGATWP